MTESITIKNLRALLKKSLDVIKDIKKNEIATVKKVTIIGMSCRLPGGISSPKDFWELLMDKKDIVSEFPKNDVLKNIFKAYLQNADDCYTTKASYLEEDITGFDARFFNLTPKEVKDMDPQQRMALELSWEAIESAGYNPLKLPSATGVFIGVIGSEYGALEKKQSNMGMYTATGALASIVSGRISHFLNISGPSISIDTACSSSLVAFNSAVQSIQSGECDMAIVGGINLFGDPATFPMLCKIQSLAPDGKCKTFSDEADGYGRGEGGGFILLKREDLAIKDQDNIIASVAATGINHDGKSSGLTVPNGAKQEELLKKTLLKGGLKENDLDFIELHGTGTALGDPIEIKAIQRAYRDRSTASPIFLTGLKPNIGHLEGAAGIVGIIKTILCIEHRAIPPQLIYGKLNKHINFDNPVCKIAMKGQSLHKPTNMFYGGVSSFGFSGCNAHAIIKNAPVKYQNKEIYSDLQAVCFSAKSASALSKIITNYSAFLKQEKVTISNLAYTTNTGRSHFSNRVAFLASSINDLEKQLLSHSEEQRFSIAPKRDTEKQHFALVLDGFIDENYLQEKVQTLYNKYYCFREQIQKIDVINIQQGNISILPFFESVNQQKQIHKPLLIFAYQMAFGKLLLSILGKPKFYIGEGIGHIAVACLTRMMSLERAITFVLNYKIPKIKKPLVFSTNGVLPEHTISTFSSKGSLIYAQKGDNLAHCKQISDTITHFPIDKEHLLNLTDPLVLSKEAIISSITGNILGIKNLVNEWSEMVLQRTNLVKCKPVFEKFSTRHIVSVSLSNEAYINLGAKVINDTFTLHTPISKKGSLFKELPRFLASMYTKGIDIGWEAFYKNLEIKPEKVKLPTYPFERDSYCADFSFENQATSKFMSPFDPQMIALPIEDKVVSFSMSAINLPLVEDTHSIVHVGFYHELLLQAVKVIWEHVDFCLKDITFLEPLILNATSREVQFVFSKQGTDRYSFTANSKENDIWVCFVKGTILFEGPINKVEKIAIKQDQTSIIIKGKAFYSAMEEKGIQLGNSVRWIDVLEGNESCLIGSYTAPRILNNISYLFPFNVTALDTVAQQLNAHIPIDVKEGFMVESIRNIWFSPDQSQIPKTCISNLIKFDRDSNRLQASVKLYNDRDELIYSTDKIEMRGVSKSYWKQLERIKSNQSQPANKIVTVALSYISKDEAIQHVIDIIARLTDLKPIDISKKDNLGTIGCDSLVSMQLKRIIDATFNVDIALQLLNPSVSTEEIVATLYKIDTDNTQAIKKGAVSTNKWIQPVSKRPLYQPKLNLYCFAYGGGNASLYEPWGNSLGEEIEVFAIQLPGRENRFEEPYFTQISELSDDIGTSILRHAGDRRFAFYGHSAGALIAYTVWKNLEREQQSKLVHFFLGAFTAPVIWPNPWLVQCNTLLYALNFEKGIHSVPDVSTLSEEKLKSVYDILELPIAYQVENKPVIINIINTLIADIVLMASFTARKELLPMECPITAFGGEKDTRVSKDDLMSWRTLTNKPFEYIACEGDHFFIHLDQNVKQVQQHVRKVLSQIVQQSNLLNHV